MKIVNVKLFMFILLVLAFLTGNAQQTVKPKFKQLRNVAYEIKQVGKKQKVAIKDYVEVNKNGLVRFKSIYYNGIADTTYQLADSIIIAINKIFDGNRKIKSYMVRDKLPNDGRYYAVQPEFLSYTNNDYLEDNFILIRPFIDENLLRIVDRITVLPSKIAYKGTAISMPLLESQILKCHNDSKYIPKEDLPNIKLIKLIKADTATTN